MLESVEVVVRKAKNKYSWHGVARLPQALKALREAGAHEYGEGLLLVSTDSGDSAEGAFGAVQARGSTEDDADTTGGQKDSGAAADAAAEAPGAAGHVDCRRERSLCLLSQACPCLSAYLIRAVCCMLSWVYSPVPPSQKFVQLFLISKDNTVSLESAAKTLLGGSASDSAKLKTKVQAQLHGTLRGWAHISLMASPRCGGCMTSPTCSPRSS